MIPARARLVRRGLLGVLTLAGLAVALSYWQGHKDRNRPDPITMEPPAGLEAGPRFGDVVIRKIVDGREAFVVRARSSQAEAGDAVRLSEVEATLPRTGGEHPGSVTITAHKALYEPRQQRARFEGDVHAKTQDDVEVQSTAFLYNFETQEGRSDDRVTFRAGRISGEGTGAVWNGVAETLTLASNVVIWREAAAGQPPLEVHSGNASLDRRALILGMGGGVRVVQGVETLDCQTLRASLTDDMKRIHRIVAIDDVVVGVPAGSGLESKMGAQGLRSIRSRRLDIVVDEGGQPTFVEAVKNAEVVLEPTGRSQRHTLSGHVIDLGLSDGGLSSISAAESVRLVVQDTSRSRGGRRTVTCDGLQAKSDAGGQLGTFVFVGGVDFVDGTRHATGGRAVWSVSAGTLALSEGARVRDDERGSDLRAVTINLHTADEGLEAADQVRHVMTRKGGTQGAGLASGATTQATADRLDYNGARKTARYSGAAVLTSDRDFVRGDEVTVEEPSVGHRRLMAKGKTSSRLHPKTNAKDKRQQEPVASSSESLVYDEARHTVDYDGNVVLTQGDITTESPKATVELSTDGTRVERLVAGEPVHVVQGLRKANGRKATYIDSKQVLVLEGDPVRMEDPTRRLEGKTVTVFLAEDRVKVESAEDDRTESIFTSEGPSVGGTRPKERRH